MNAGKAAGFVVAAAIGAVIGTIAVQALKNWAAGRTTAQWLQAHA